MIDVRIEDRTIVEERGISGDSLELMTEAVTLAAYVLDFLAKDETTHSVLKSALADGIRKLDFGNIRDGAQPDR